MEFTITDTICDSPFRMHSRITMIQFNIAMKIGLFAAVISYQRLAGFCR